MNKKLIAAAASAVMAWGVGYSAVASAEATVYGRIVAGAIYNDNDKADDDGAWNFGAVGRDGGSAPGSRFGFRGSTDLGNGMEAGFQIEYAIQATNDASISNNHLRNRHNNLYLSGGWGRLTLGQQGSPYLNALNWDQTNFYGGQYDTYRYEGINYSMSTGPFSLNIMALANDTNGDSTVGAVTAADAVCITSRTSTTRVTCDTTGAIEIVPAVKAASAYEVSGDDGVDGWIIHAGYDFGIAALNFAHQADNKDVEIAEVAVPATGDDAIAAAVATNVTNRDIVDANASRDRTAIGVNGSVGSLDWYLAWETSELNTSGYENDVDAVGGFLGWKISERDVLYGYYVDHSADRVTAALGEDYTETIVGYSRQIGPGVKFIAEYQALDLDLVGNDVGSDPSKLALAIKLDF